jgi:peptidoglycan hydrolase CwlO-like protein
MNLAETELSIGGVKFKGIYIVILVSLATTIGSFVWTASSLYSRLESVESRAIPQVAPIEEKIGLIEQQLKDNDIASLSAKLATLGTNLETIVGQQEKLLELSKDVSTLEKDIETMKSTVKQAELISESLGDVDDRIKIVNKEINDLWDGMDYLSNPLK